MEKKIKIHLNQNKYDWLEFINRNRSSLGIIKFDFTGTHIDVILNIDNFYEKYEHLTYRD